MSCHIAICDDSAADAAFDRELLTAWAEERREAVEIQVFPSAESFLFRYDEDKDFDILLLDIEMAEMDGVTLARKIRRVSDTVEIVFITGYSDYIAEGYDVAALHYLMKPVSREKFFSVMDRAAEKLRKNQKLLTLDTAEGLVRMPVGELRWAEVRGNYVTLHGREDCTAKMTLGRLMEELDDRFYRVGRSYAVNLMEIGRVTKTEIRMLSGDAIPLPRGAYEGVNRAIIERT